MSTTLALGPLLGFENGDLYTVCILLDEAVQVAPQLLYAVSETTGQTPAVPAASVAFQKIADVGSVAFWRAEVPLPSHHCDRTVQYSIEESQNPGVGIQDRHGRNLWSFYVPKTVQQGEDGPRVAYASCNGFSSVKLLRDEEHPHAMWERMRAEHEKSPYSLLLMGGDQVYADQLWESSCRPAINAWCSLSWDAQNRAAVTPEIRQEIHDFYNSLYLQQWSQVDVSWMLASVPSIMMWDDHDIFDGWGSYPWERQNCAVFKEVFLHASRVFELFQLRGSSNNRLNSQANHRTLSVSFSHYQILALDNRSERTTDPQRGPNERIMSNAHWQDLKRWFERFKNAEFPNANELLVMTGVPVVYRSFATVESAFDATPWHEELEDDVRDHWSAKGHLQERMRLVTALTEALANRRACRTLFLSGDVHVGSLGQIRDLAKNVRITQVVSSGIVHPPPSAAQWAALRLMTNPKPEQLLGGDAIAEALVPQGADAYLRTRNYATLHRGTDDQLWINWICEDEDLQPHHTIR